MINPMDPKPKVATEAAAPVSTAAENTQLTTKAILPKRLIALMIIYTLAAISGLMSAPSMSDLGAMLCWLTLLMVIAVFGRQKAALYMLRGYSVLQLAFYSFLPVIMYDPDNLVAGPTTVNFGLFQAVVSDWVIFSVLIAIGIAQVWISFDKHVKAWFKPRINMNIMS
ncbi:hypothetical protein [Shewanella gaetbuli]|uniref:Uncharacterized protein n=1 Tax=Shewanella gaetbuli TaxID=220752 RepID=A0A9X2CHE1_9GAMM|nr:hypothetical protein [Shewanella gaetbuli]MCL1141932.1 hypothetical protein [Shewanella gaetbuli]